MASYEKFSQSQRDDVKQSDETCCNELKALRPHDLSTYIKTGNKIDQNAISGTSRGVGVVFKRFLENDVSAAVTIFQQDEQPTCLVNHQTSRDRFLAEALQDLLLQQGVPDIDLDCFDGNVLEFNYFMTIFEDMVEGRIKDPGERLTRLIKYTRGEAKELIKGCIRKPPTRGYVIAKQLLEKRFGDPHRILAAYQKELRSLNQPNPGDCIWFSIVIHVPPQMQHLDRGTILKHAGCS